MVKTYRRRPITVKAIQFEDSRESVKACLEFLGQDVEKVFPGKEFDEYCKFALKVGMRFSAFDNLFIIKVNDWIVKSANDTIHVVSPDVFISDFERV